MRPSATLSASRGLTLLLIALYCGGSWDVRVPAVCLVAIALAFPHLQTRRWTWSLLSGVLILGLLSRATVVDNHKVLLVYWTIAHVVAARRQSIAELRLNARLLIGLCFVFASMWKVISSEFRDGTFMAFTLLTDQRFAGISSWITGQPLGEFAANEQLTQQLFSGARQQVELFTSPGIELLADAMTGFAVITEILIAVAFLFARKSRILRRIRNPVLILFLMTTYSIASVVGFAWILAIMGYTQCTQAERWARRGYVAALCCAQVFTIPWRDYLVP